MELPLLLQAKHQSNQGKQAFLLEWIQLEYYCSIGSIHEQSSSLASSINANNRFFMYMAFCTRDGQKNSI